MPAAPPTGGACVRAVAARMCCATRVYAVRSSNEEKRLVDHESQQYTNFRERAARKSVRCTASDGLAKYAVIKIDPNHHTKPREWAPPKRISKTNNDTSCFNQNCPVEPANTSKGVSLCMCQGSMSHTGSQRSHTSTSAFFTKTNWIPFSFGECRGVSKKRGKISLLLYRVPTLWMNLDLASLADLNIPSLARLRPNQVDSKHHHHRGWSGVQIPSTAGQH